MGAEQQKLRLLKRLVRTRGTSNLPKVKERKKHAEPNEAREFMFRSNVSRFKMYNRIKKKLLKLL